MEEKSIISKTSTIKSGKFSEDLKNKLAYEWKNIFRGLTQADFERKGTVTIQTFNKIIHQHKVYLSREELRKVESIYGTGEVSGMGQDFDYVRLSQELGLHKQSFDFIKQKKGDQLSKFKDNESKLSLKSDLLQYGEAIKQGKANSTLKTRSAIEFLQSIDKGRHGTATVHNFYKVVKMFGLQVDPKLVP
mmetsp:Transcript_10657/g.10766  ORF Transcript_10657/g.10766 Transcript_10657/m.10766 type:complete len:190 (-) Transcript_10657:91-660(-)